MTYSICVGLALHAAEQLAKEGIGRDHRPATAAAAGYGNRRGFRATDEPCVVTVEEGWPICGICAEIPAQVIEQAFDYLDAPPARVTRDAPMPYAANLEEGAAVG